jgi:hypothetical protein
MELMFKTSSLIFKAILWSFPVGTRNKGRIITKKHNVNQVPDECDSIRTFLMGKFKKPGENREKMNCPRKIKKAFNIYRQKPFIIWCLGRKLNK